MIPERVVEQRICAQWIQQVMSPASKKPAWFHGSKDEPKARKGERNFQNPYDKGYTRSRLTPRISEHNSLAYLYKHAFNIRVPLRLRGVVEHMI